MTIFDIGDRIWTTKDGQKIKYRDLKESHIKNIVNYPFVEIVSHTSIVDNADNYYEEIPISYKKEMQLELLRRTVCKTLNIEL